MAQTRHAFANDEGQVRITCPQCQAMIELQAPDDSRGGEMLEITCKSCEEPLAVLVERRRFVRLDKLLPGLFWRPGDKKKIAMVVEDLSIAGIRFAMEDIIPLEIGERLEIEYMHYGERVGSCVQVRTVKGHLVGGLFASHCEDQNH